MKRILIWVSYGVGTLAMLYLVLYAYAAFTGRDLQPGDPIHIFRKPDAPDYSARGMVLSPDDVTRRCGQGDVLLGADLVLS